MRPKQCRGCRRLLAQCWFAAGSTTCRGCKNRSSVCRRVFTLMRHAQRQFALPHTPNNRAHVTLLFVRFPKCLFSKKTHHLRLVPIDRTQCISRDNMMVVHISNIQRVATRMVEQHARALLRYVSSTVSENGACSPLLPRNLVS